MSEKKKGLEFLREPFPENQISKLPKGTKIQNECPASEKINCKVCGGWHHPKVIHLDYVGHAALTDRLLDADPLWTWEPFALKDGLPAFDNSGGLWIKLTVCGHTRIGYGHAAASSFKEIGAREKEVIGDALRNAAMRFGAALDLWHKGDLHGDEEGQKAVGSKIATEPEPQGQEPQPQLGDIDIIYVDKIESKHGTKTGKPWTSWAIFNAAGDKYGTIKKEIMELADKAKAEQLPFEITYEVNQYGKNIKQAKIIEEREPGEEG